MPLTFGQQVELAVIQYGLLAVIVLVAGFLLNRILERYKSDLDWRRTVAAARLEAYRQLWAVTKRIGGTGKHSPLPADERRIASSALSDWYWDKGNGLFLSHDTTAVLMAGWQMLDDQAQSADLIREHYTALRTHLKREMGVYTPAQAEQPVRVNPTAA